MSETIAVVIPTNRPERIKRFLEAWQPNFRKHEADVIVVVDGPDSLGLPKWVEEYSWKAIDFMLDDSAWVIARRSPAVRSFGIWLALQRGTDIIVTMDDDCLPNRVAHEDFLGKHREALSRKVMGRWINPICHLPARGLPLDPDMWPVVAHVGMWLNYPDIDSLTQLEFGPRPAYEVPDRPSRIPYRTYMPMSSMNLSFRKVIAPAFYFPDTGPTAKRWNDIWAGIFAKRIADGRSMAMTFGPPFVWHERASDPVKNLDDELPGYLVNELIVRSVERADSFAFKGQDILDHYERFAWAIAEDFPGWRHMTRAMHGWIRLLRKG